MRGIRFGSAAASLAAAALFCQATSAQAAFSTTEMKCSQTIAKSYAKLESTILKAKTKCHASDLSGKVNDPNDCSPLPADALAKIDKAKSKLVSKVAKACHGSCNITTDLDCVSDLSCPANHQSSPPNNSVAETCSGFKLSRLDWPGPYCDSLVGHAMLGTEDLGTCLVGLADTPANAVDRQIFADLNESSSLSSTAQKCLTSIAKAVPKALSSIYLATARCRDERRSANKASFPAWACGTADASTQAEISEALDSLGAKIDKACTDSDIASLTGLCGSVVSSPPSSKAEAKACLAQVLREAGSEEQGITHHEATPFSMINATHPNSAAPYCGDGVVTARREEHTGVGEECDGDADAACGSGSCYPPGDTFECTCDTTPRERFIVDGGAAHTDSDAGWKGASHDATHNDGYGYVTELSNCTCDAFTGATCTGGSSSPVCDVYGNMAPRCSDDLHGTQTCDQRGNGNGLPENWDCFRCDDDSLNAGQFCANGSNANETVCQSQCVIDATGVGTGTPCQNQANCPDGQSCRGRCDNSVTCNTMTEGSPLPQVSAAVSVCIMLEYKTDITGTKNIVTGDQAVNYTTRSNIQLGALFTVPCPVCGGSCPTGTNINGPCSGRCNVSNDPCLDDSDCTGPGDTSCVATDDDCPCYGRCDVTTNPCLTNADCCTNPMTCGSQVDTQCAPTPDECALATCSLDLRCSAGPNATKLCRPDSATPLGLVSHDCPPSTAANLSGIGVTQPFGNVTTGEVEFPTGGACTASNWHNFECPCPADDGATVGVPTAPNGCAATCDGGANQGQGCGNVYGGIGSYTTCVGGTDAGFACDEDSDCEGLGASCSGNPKECTAGTASLIGTLCTTNANCGPGGLCEDACPGGRCLPLCYPQGACNGGARNGDPCATTGDCRQCTAGNPLMNGLPCRFNSACDSSTGAGDGVCSLAGGVTCDPDDDEEGLCASGPAKYRCTGEGFTTLPCFVDSGTCQSSHCTSGSASLIGAACSVSSDCLVNGVPVPKGCESGNNGVLGDSDDTPGAGNCEPRPEDCYINNGYAIGGGTATDVNVNAAFCTPPNANSSINVISGFGGPSRIRRSGTADVNVTSIP